MVKQDSSSQQHAHRQNKDGDKARFPSTVSSGQLETALNFSEHKSMFQLHEAQVLQQLSHQLVGTLDLNEIVDILYMTCTIEIGLEYVLLSLVDKAACCIKAIGGIGVDERVLHQINYALDGSSLLANIVRTGQGELISSVAQLDELKLWSITQCVDCVRIFLPMTLRGETFGVVEVGLNPQSPPALKEAQIRLLRATVEQTALAIDSAQRFAASLSANEALQESENRLKQFIDAIPVGVFVVNAASEITYANTAAKQVLDSDSVTTITLAELANRIPMYVAGSEQLYPAQQIPALRALQGESATITDVEIEHAQRRIPLQVKASPVFGAAGQVEYAVVAFSDLTEQKESEMALKQASIQNEQLIASISSILIGLTPDNHISHWNEAATKTFNITWRKAIGRPLTELDLRWNGAVVSRGLTACRESKQPVHLTNLPYTRPDNREGVLNIHINPYQQLPEELGFLLLAEEITEQKILEGQLAQAQKLEAIGQLAAGIAHEINTPTQYIGDNISFLQSGLDKVKCMVDHYETLLMSVQTIPEAKPVLAELDRLKQQLKLSFLLNEMPQAVQDALEGVERVTKIVQAMKMFSHPGVAQKTAIDLNQAIESTITVARNEWKYVAEVETDFEPNLPPVPCLPGEFNQVILNLIINAVHAIKDVVSSKTKGKIKLTTRCAGDWVEIRIGDSGTGIPEEIRSKIFHPFFTTKEVGRGTGQGLAIAHSVIVEKHGGTIAFETEMGRGTTFILRLPLVPQPESTDVADIH